MALTQTQVSQLYVAIFNRASEGSGNTYWQSFDNAAAAASEMLATTDAQEYFDDSLDSDQDFIEHIYLNTLNKTPDDDAEGIAFWVDQLEDGASRGEVVASLVAAIESYGPDGENYDPDDAATVAAYNQFANRVEVSNYMAANVDNPPANYAQSTRFDEDLVVTDDDATVTTAQAAVDVLAEAEDDDDDPAVEGDIFTLTADTDDKDGTDGDDFFDAPITQNPGAGGVSNSLSTADRLDGAAGTDTLHAELVPEFFGTSGDHQMDVQPRIESIEDIRFEAMDITFPWFGGALGVTVDAKNIKDVDKIGSFFSDGDLVIENLTTLTSEGVARNTDTITITMDHTDNFNTDGDASDLDVYFDEDYLLSDQSVQSQAIYYLLDQDADMNDADVDGDGVVDLLARINTNGLIFTVDGGPEQVIEFDEQMLEDLEILSHEDFVAALQDPLAALIAAGDVPADTTLTVDPTMTRTTFLDDGSVSSPIPAIVLESQSTTGLESVGFNWVEDLSGEYNVYGRLADQEGTEDNPVAINVELHKVGRDNDGGDLFIGGKHDEGIPDFYVEVLGAGEDDPTDPEKPSNLGYLGTNEDDLENVYISTHADYVDGETFASLTIRDGFGNNDDGSDASVDLVDADDFLGDLTLGSDTPVDDLIVLEARGGGDVTFHGDVDADGNAYSYTTGSGDDAFDIDLDGGAVDTIGESFSITTGSGDDEVLVDDTSADPQDGVSQLTMATLDNLDISTGGGEDYVELSNDFRFNIHAGADSDFVYIDSADTDAAVGTWSVGALTGPQPFVDRVLYEAQLTVTFAGFESTVDVDTNAAGNFVADQMTINAAIMEAIEENPELDRLLTVTPGTGDQQLTITSTVDGENELAIDLYQPTLVTAGDPTDPGEVNLATADATSLLTGIIKTDATEDSETDPLAYVNTIDGSLNADGTVGTAGLWDGEAVNLSNDFLDAPGGANAPGVANINFSTINMGTGANDLVVLDSNELSANILDIDAAFGKVSVVNFFDEAALDTVGRHALDFTTFLNNQSDDTDNDNNLSAVPIAVTLDTNLNPTVAADIDANEVKMIRLDETEDDTFEGLTANKLVTALNGDGTADDNYANIDDSIDAVATTADLVGLVQNHIFMVENDNNRGEYKVFHLTSTIDEDTDTTDGDFDTVAVMLGTLDFGNSINFNLVGQADWATDFAGWHAEADGAEPVPGDDDDDDDDDVAPTLESRTPADEATDVAVNSPIVLTFDEAVAAGTGFITVYNAADDSVVEAVDVADAAIAGETVTIGLTDDLAAGTDYYVEIDDGAIVDLAGNAYAGITDDSYNFTTEPPDVDEVAPELVSRTPEDGADGATEVAVGSPIVLTFDEDVEAGAGFITVYNAADDSVVEAVDVADAAIAGETVTIGLTDDLAYRTEYYVEIDDGAIVDLAGNAYAGITDDSYNFTTELPDGTPRVMEAGTTYDAEDGVVELFYYDVDSSSGRAVGKDGEVDITNFTVGEDWLVFEDVENGTMTDANFTDFDGVSLAESPFDDYTTIAFDPDEGVASLITIAGIQDEALDTIDFAVV